MKLKDNRYKKLPILISGGTNSLTGKLARQCGVNFNGIAIGTYARKIIRDYRGDIKRSHIKMKHPYNTYYIKGLPPSPIGLVSRSSIEAALNPTEGSFLYFVSKGDGTHFFSSTLEEHNRAVQKYQLNK